MALMSRNGLPYSPLWEKILALASEPRRTVVLVTFRQLQELRAGFTIGDWAEWAALAQTYEADPLDRARMGNVTIRLKEPPPATPAIVDLTEEF
jgi:hypothetical protein